MSNSFYGGRPGASFVIAKTYVSFDEASVELVGIENQNIVGFGEYILIDHPDGNYADDGDVYRRGYNGLEYIGNIKGPAGPAPLFEIGDYTEEPETKMPQNSEDFLFGNGEINIENSLVPGKTNDSIKYSYYSYKDKETDINTNAAVGFQVPYPEFDFTTERVSAYTEEPTVTLEANDRPFYHKYKIQIPKGVKGDSVTDIQLNDTKNLLTFTTSSYDNSTVAKTTKSFPVNYIKNITRNSTNGDVTVSYTNNTTDTFNLREIKNFSVENGRLVASYLNGESNDLGIPWDGYASILVSRRYEYSTLTNNGAKTVVAALKEEFPNGIDGQMGHIVSVTNGSETSFFAFDYSKNEWYGLGGFVENDFQIFNSESDVDRFIQDGNYHTGSVAFLYKELEIENREN